MRGRTEGWTLIDNVKGVLNPGFTLQPLRRFLKYSCSDTFLVSDSVGLGDAQVKIYFESATNDYVVEPELR